MSKPVLSIGFDVPFDEAIKWGKERISVLPDVFYDVLPAQARSRAFTVSGLSSLDQIQGVLDSLTRAMEQGETFADWKKTLDPKVLALGNARLDNIFRTNIQTHYNIGRYQQQEANKAHRPFRMYDAINDGRTRPHHRALDNFIAPIDDPVWAKIMPPLGFRCRCSSLSLTEAQARQRGWKSAPELPADGHADEGWDYDKLTGQDAALAKIVSAKISQCDAFTFARGRAVKPVWCDDRGMDYIKTLAAALDGFAPMPAPRRFDLPLLPTGRDDRYYLTEFMAAFDARHDETAVIKDKTGLHDLAVSGLMFEDHKTGKSKIAKNGRAPWLPYLARTILDPDEIRLHEGGHGDRSLYLLSRFAIRSEVVNMFSVFNRDGEVWTGWTGYQDHRQAYLELKRRNGILIYRRPEM